MRPTLSILAFCAALAGCTGPQFLNSLTPSGGYRHAQGLVYDAGTRLTLDVYTPVNARRAPA